MAESFEELIAQAKNEDAFWAEKAILEFTQEIFRLMAAKNVSRAELARRIGSSPAYVTKILSGNANFTIDSMVKLTRAIGAHLEVHAVDDSQTMRFIVGRRPSQPIHAQFSIKETELAPGMRVDGARKAAF